MTNKTEDVLIEVCQMEAKRLQKEMGRPEKGIVSTQVLAVIVVLARLLSVMQIDDAVNELPH